MRHEVRVWLVGVLGAVMLSCVAGASAETFVLPVVARGVPGINGSVWDSEVRISGPYQGLPPTVRRLWVALPGGGFVDDVETAPRWVFPTFTMPAGMPLPLTFTVLTGDQLLQRTEALKGAVAIEVEGTGNHVFLHNANTLGQPRLPQGAAEEPACCLPGNGQLIRGLSEPLVQNGAISWITSGRSPYRVSVGVINPTDQSRAFTIEMDVTGPWPNWPPGEADGTYWLANGAAALSFELPPWGFRQIDDLAAVLLEQCPSCSSLDRVAPAAVYVIDAETSMPFYAYASVIWTPLNDPEFVAAEPYGR